MFSSMQISTLIWNNTPFLFAHYHHHHFPNEIPNVYVSGVDFGEFDHPLNLLFIVHFRKFPCFCSTTTTTTIHFSAKLWLAYGFTTMTFVVDTNTFMPNERSHVGKNSLQMLYWEHSMGYIYIVAVHLK